MWTGTTVAGLMLGLSRMVGVERFNLALQSGGRDSVDGDWGHISTFPTFEEGFASLALIAAAAGWGLWEVVSLDRDTEVGRFRCKNGWEATYQRTLSVCWGSGMMGGKFAGFCARLFGKNCWAQQVLFQARGDEADEFIVRPSDRTVEGDLERLLAADAATRADLAVALERLRQEVEERRATEDALRRTEKENAFLIDQQARTIAALSTPIMQVWEGILTLPIVGQVSGARATTIMQALLQEIVQRGAHYAILDLTGVDALDAETADHLLRIVRAAELLGARAIVSGIQPKVAQTIVQLGVDLAGLTTVADLEEGLKTALRSMGVRAPAPGLSPSQR
ncbi:STAS domain-containing protein [Polyangium sp. 6x1]|uniref:STAS domain-containing protein n=1 Tax=Polyangium sp. 6x1 TaxID=3042689 RepID=UPI0024821709|nr:STAS domain-containing protein [Polyangium sp. 6x1]MDI1444993.1 STAS domain-containing protein [Polyangium sp. 6x1]